jgi:hypothetical protein
MSMDISGVSAAMPMDPMSGASYSAPPQQKMSNLIDTSGSGSITQAQFNQAFQTNNPPAVFQQQGAAAIFSALDPSGSGSVSKQDFVSGMSSLMVSLRAAPATTAGSSATGSLAASTQSLNQLGAPSSTDPYVGSQVNLTA